MNQSVINQSPEHLFVMIKKNPIREMLVLFQKISASDRIISAIILFILSIRAISPINIEM